MISLSSARRARIPLRDISSSVFSIFPGASLRLSVSAIFIDRLIINLDPLPTSLSTAIVPPISSISFFVMAIPSPVPITLLSVELCSRSKLSYKCGRNSSDIPMPVSSTIILKCALSESVLFSSLILRDILPPSLVYLTALLRMFRRTSLNFVESI